MKQGISKKSVWLIGLFLIPLFVLLSLNVMGFCFQKMKFVSKNEIYFPIHQLVIGIAEMGMAKKIFVNTESGTKYNYDKDDIEKISLHVDSFFKQYPESIRINRHYSLNQSEAYDVSVTYLFSKEEINQVNSFVKENGHKQFSKKIIGVTYWQSYSVCGHPTFGMQDYIYEGVADFQSRVTFKNKMEIE